MAVILVGFKAENPTVNFRGCTADPVDDGADNRTGVAHRTEHVFDRGWSDSDVGTFVLGKVDQTRTVIENLGAVASG